MIEQRQADSAIGFDPKIPEFFILWANANGAQLLSADGKKANLNDPKAVEALAYTKSLIDEQGGWQQVQVVPRHLGFLRREEPGGERTRSVRGRWRAGTGT